MSRHRTTGRSGGFGARRALTATVPVLLVASTVIACTASTPPAPRTAKVERTSVTSGVSAVGALTALDEVNLGFPKGGQLTTVDVKVGDTVKAGQVLATVDDFAAKQALSQARGQLAAQQAALARLTAAPSVDNSRSSLDQARDVVDRTADQGDAVQSADAVALRNANRQLDLDQKTLDDAQDKQHDDCPDGDPGPATPVSATVAPTASPMLASLGGTAPAGTGMSTSTCTAAVYQADKAAVTMARRTVVADTAARDAADEKEDVDKAGNDLAVANAQQGVVSAQNGVNSATADRPGALAQQNAAVATAAAAAGSAQRDADNTTLRAPADATVSVLNGVVGEFLAPSAGTSALAPGSAASIPGTSGSSGTAASAGGAAAAAASPTRPGGTQFLVLDDLHQFQVVLPFTEADAAAISPGQKVQLSVDSVPDLTANGAVLAVAPIGTALAGVISYYVTISLPGDDPRLKAGMTAHAEVVTSETPGVLAVPTNAVHQQNGARTVTVVDDAGNQRVVTITVGTTGDGRTQVLSGLREGDAVVLPATP